MMNPAYKQQVINSPKNNKEKKQEVLSKRDLEELMGTKRPTYKRHNGALRQRG
ncbi:hypothetical protein [Niallia circulans]|uniref:hypothetical protein n=1 Tax=Niallia circulans TaxID=1397 RepID=UPI0015610CBA|nr:hypothetical protein [Niallia circulans]NRG32921.1 hypothetical protein [Niallia circulans]